MPAADPAIARRFGDLRSRYRAEDVDTLRRSEPDRFGSLREDDLTSDPALAWELLYHLEPGLYDRLASAEPLHPAILDWLPEQVAHVVEVGAGGGRLTLDLCARVSELVAVEPAAPLRAILERKLAESGHSCEVRVVDGVFAALPAPDGWADLVVTCSALTRDERQGGDSGLAEMERVCRPGGMVVIVWPNNLDWLRSRGYVHRSFDGYMQMRFTSTDQAVELAEIFYPDHADEVRSRGVADVPYELLGVNPPRDIAYKVMQP